MNDADVEAGTKARIAEARRPAKALLENILGPCPTRNRPASAAREAFERLVRAGCEPDRLEMYLTEPVKPDRRVAIIQGNVEPPWEWWLPGV